MSTDASYPKIAQLKTVAALRARLAELGIDLPIDDKNPLRRRRLAPRPANENRRPRQSPIAGASIPWKAGTPTATARPPNTRSAAGATSASSGAKLIWGGEAAAVRPDGRANPNQTLATESNRAGLAALLTRTNHRPPRRVRLARRPPRRPAAHPLRPLLQTRRPPQDAPRGSPTITRCSTPSSRSTRTTNQSCGPTPNSNN